MTLFEPVERPVRRVSLVRLSAELARALGGLGRVAVEGEVHRPTVRAGGRTWFTLKDRAAQIDVTVPGSRARRARAVAGERVMVTGTLEWVAGWGRAQLVAEEVVPVGAGAVAAMIAEARDRLRVDGLLDRPRRALPRLPEAIGVVCGADAAVRADILSVVEDRFPGYPVVFREVTVSGPGAAGAIVAALDDLDRRPGVEVVILARGGGDATHLLPFSDEDLCRAICSSRTPVVTAIGHEGDRPLCDEVADLRCGTPSMAAAAVVPDRRALREGLERRWLAAEAAASGRLADAGRRLGGVDRDRAVAAGVQRAGARLERAAGRLALHHPVHRARTAGAALAAARRELEALGPRRVLERGYAVVRTAAGAVVRDVEGLSPGDRLAVQVAGGSLTVEVVDAAGTGGSGR